MYAIRTVMSRSKDGKIILTAISVGCGVLGTTLVGFSAQPDCGSSGTRMMPWLSLYILCVLWLYMPSPRIALPAPGGTVLECREYLSP